ncbi:hypothetical protein NP493_412g02020 [Ridgeia piscesae]|uniref:Uncharacterized protein n=1 Tax=Ridgeia piscesae TaxID=27915 RepID=A0AAD9L144_RIDPI|nr:hypothetical protein NP493_412g02020 [Ridgeia piscesae]
MLSGTRTLRGRPTAQGTRDVIQSRPKNYTSYLGKHSQKTFFRNLSVLVAWRGSARHVSHSVVGVQKPVRMSSLCDVPPHPRSVSRGVLSRQVLFAQREQ